MRTNIVIDDFLMEEALKLSDLKTKKSVIEKALKLLIRLEKQDSIKKLRGKLKWEGDLNKMRSE
ncbi:MAG: type II toxin-antitoxin system VapB family antitoxin [Bacteroidales bacterium]|nr:type II toxin-antitoxin system VapB family antitoxin [Bacteroidales bacterium]